MPIIYVFWLDSQEKKFEINKQTYESDKYEFVDMLRLETKKCLKNIRKLIALSKEIGSKGNPYN